jgi:hypothetical protein
VVYCSPGSVNAEITIASFEDTANIHQSQNANFKSKTIFAFLIATAAANITTSVLVTARFIYAHKALSMSEASPGYGNSPYLNAITVCVESSVMITFTTSVTCILFFRVEPTSSTPAGIPAGSLAQALGVPIPGPTSAYLFAGALALLPQICVS